MLTPNCTIAGREDCKTSKFLVFLVPKGSKTLIHPSKVDEPVCRDLDENGLTLLLL